MGPSKKGLKASSIASINPPQARLFLIASSSAWIQSAILLRLQAWPINPIRQTLPAAGPKPALFQDYTLLIEKILQMLH